MVAGHGGADLLADAEPVALAVQAIRKKIDHCIPAGNRVAFFENRLKITIFFNNRKFTHLDSQKALRQIILCDLWPVCG